MYSVEICFGLKRFLIIFHIWIVITAVSDRFNTPIGIPFGAKSTLKSLRTRNIGLFQKRPSYLFQPLEMRGFGAAGLP